MSSFVYPQPFILRPADDLAERQPHLRHAAAKLADDYASARVVTDAELQAIGSALWNALPAETAQGLEAALQAAETNVLPLILESRAPAAQALPWETLHHPAHGFLARSPRFAFSRRYAPRAGESLPARPAPLKILLFTSLPDDVNPETERLNVEKEQERLQLALLPFVTDGRVTLEITDDGRLETLKDLLKRFAPHVLILSGHGKFVRPPLGEKPYGVFLFESETGAGQPVTEDELAEALIGSGAQAVILSACESGKAASDDLTRGLTQRLAALGVPHVMGMRESALDEAGILFADALCKALAEGERADVAIQTARAAMTAPVAGIARREAGMNLDAERLSGQWTLPMLIAPDPARPLADWANFSPSPSGRGGRGEGGKPMRFIGRRRELRQTKHRLLTGALTRLFISGAGGHGKTTLARKLAYELQARGYRFFEWRADSPWRDFQQTLELALEGERGKTYDRLAMRLQAQPAKLAQKCFELLDEKYEGKLALLFDNLEAIQDDKTYRLKDETAQAWLNAALNSTCVALATSRWVLPDWNGEHLPLGGMNYGDFLRLAQSLEERKQMNPRLLHERERLKQVYEALGHNPRGLEWFAAATLTMNPQEEAAFAQALAQTREDLRQNMALAETLRRLPPAAFALLRRLHVYEAPVPAEGILKLAWDAPDSALDDLLAFSLLEVTENQDYEVLEYQIEPSLLLYLKDQHLLDDDPQARRAAADFMLWLMRQERRTYTHLALTIEALRRAQRHDQADRLTLDALVERFTLDGRYAELLARWLPRVCQSEDLTLRGRALNEMGQRYLDIGDPEKTLVYLKQALEVTRQTNHKQGEGALLNNISQIFKAQGDYETALAYLKQSLTICQQIGDKKGEGATLNNISQIFKAQGDYETALAYLKQSLTICQQIGDKAGEGATLGNIGNIYHAQGDYETALAYLKQSLTICQQIGDKAGEGATLGNIGNIYHAQGDYETALAYLKQSLTIRQQIGDKAGEGATLGNIGNIYHAQGDYETALAYLKQSLTIRQQIGDKAGLCATLFNIGHIHAQKEEFQQAVSAWLTAYLIAKQIGYAQVLQALANLAPQLGLPAGLAGWDGLAQKMQSAEGGMQNENAEEVSQLEQVEAFVTGVVRAHRQKRPEAPQLFQAVSTMAADPNAPPEYQALGKVLRDYMAGINPDLSNLPKALAEIVEKAIREE